MKTNLLLGRVMTQYLQTRACADLCLHSVHLNQSLKPQYCNSSDIVRMYCVTLESYPYCWPVSVRKRIPTHLLF